MKLENLYEGVKFGNSEIQELKKESNKILIGIEYEFLPDHNEYPVNDDDNYDGYDSHEDDIDQELAEVYEEYLTNNIEEDGLDILINDLLLLTRMDAGRLDFNVYPNPQQLTTENLGQLREDLAFIETILAGNVLGYVSRNHDVSTFNDSLDMVKSAIGYRSYNIDNTSFKGIYESAMEDINSIIAKLEAGEEDVTFDEDMLTSIRIIGGILERFAMFVNNHSHTDVADALAKEIWPYDADDLAEMKYSHSVQDELQSRRDDDSESRSDSGGDLVDLEDIKRNMESFGIDTSELEKYHHEHEEMVEFVTKPMPMLKSIDYMKKMFKFIDDNGTTESYSGMHVNISIKGKFFLKDNFDVLKLFLLLDQKFISEGDKYAKFLGFAPRGMVAKVLNQYVPFSVLVQLAGSKNTDELIKNTKELISLNTKYQQLNFKHIFSGENSIERHRIEARYFGGEGYHKREVEMEWQIYRLAYMLEIAFNPEFEREEYLKKLIKFLDQISMMAAKVSFAELSRQVKAGGTITSYEDVVLPSDLTTRGEKSVLIKQQNKDLGKMK